MEKDYKYPRTKHLPFSPGYTADDERLMDIANFKGKQIVISDKLDGECTTITSKRCYARSLDSKHHPSRTWVKRIQSEVGHNIPSGFRVCGENVYAKHSIFYDKLTAYFYVYSIWTDANICLSWDETVEWAELLGLSTVPVLYEGVWDETAVKACWTGVSCFGPEQEGYVVRVRDCFSYNDFGQNVAKFVREKHVQTSSHWMEQEIVPNLLR